MLTYTAIFLVSLIVAGLVFVIYKAVVDTRKAINRSKQRVAIVSHPATHQGEKVARKPQPVINTKPFPEWNSDLAPMNMAKAYPAMSNKQFNFGFEGNENHVGEHDSHPAAAHKGCSLYNVITEEPKIQPRQNKVWPQREDKLEPAGKAFNVPGRTVPVSPGLDSKGKPWGW